MFPTLNWACSYLFMLGLQPCLTVGCHYSSMFQLQFKTIGTEVSAWMSNDISLFCNCLYMS